ncbi:ribonuclease J [Maritalea porphyrae]|uniref:ribonuclease J n=1 Tax=Maritalea porphyrae TaxID=880732 RepID=UPI0022B049D2|nr:ribonuclease J [Maritalea porphyrae]MCZ4273023.1 ribonuclease J [Maritalea porphyrae]
MSDQLIFVPLGGVGEIGMNFGLYGYGAPEKRKWLIVDCGLTFAKPDLPGIDLVMPDIRFLEDEVDNIEGLVLTHAHEDHYGALLDLWPYLECPVFATPFAKAMTDSKAKSNNFTESVPITVVNAGEKFKAGPFALELINVSHSIPESCSLYIETTAGRVLHTGDWKLDPSPIGNDKTDEKRFREIGEDPRPLAVVGDSTNAIREGSSPGEGEVAETLFELISNAPHRVAVTIFASNVGRMISIARAAQKAGRHVVAAGRSVHRVSEIARDLGLMDDLEPFLDQDAYGYLPREKVVLICTGSQGESRAAMARIARDDHPMITLAKGDRVIFSSKAIPGNERDVGDIQNMLINQGVEIITDRDALIHVSGHPRRDELRQLYDWLKPDILVPAHGEALHLDAHLKLGQDLGIKHCLSVRNGDLAQLYPVASVNKGEVPSGRVYLDGEILCQPEESGVRDRRRLSFSGTVNLSLCVNSKGQVLHAPEFELVGLPALVDEDGDFAEVVEAAIESTVKSMPAKKRADKKVLAEALRRSVRSEINQLWGKKPHVKVFVHRV